MVNEKEFSEAIASLNECFGKLKRVLNQIKSLQELMGATPSTDDQHSIKQKLQVLSECANTLLNKSYVSIYRH